MKNNNLPENFDAKHEFSFLLARIQHIEYLFRRHNGISQEDFIESFKWFYKEEELDE